MIVKVVDDHTLKIVSDPEHDQKFKDHYVTQPNSVRRDILLSYTVPVNELTHIRKNLK